MTRQGRSVFGVAVVVIVVAYSGVVAASPPSRKPGVQPAAKGPNPATAVVAASLAEVLAKSPTALDASQQAGAVEIALRGGDVASAERLLDAAKPGSVDNRTAAQVGAQVLGGPHGARARALLAKHRAGYNEVGTLEGIAIGYARAGNVRQALAEVAKLKDASLERMLLAEMLTVRPAAAFMEAYAKHDRSSMSGPHAERLLRAYLALNQPAKAEALAREMRNPDAALRAGGGQGATARKPPASPTSTEADPVIFRGMFFGRLAAGQIEQAVALEQERFDKAMVAATQAKDPRFAEFGARSDRYRAYQAIVAALALKGDAAGAREKAGVVKGDTSAMNVPLAYVTASTGDAAAADAFVAAVGPPAQWSGTPDYRPAVLGAASAGRFAAGDKAGAERYAQQALALVGSIQRPNHRAAALLQLLAGTTLGPEALLFVEQRHDTYPLRLPPK